jgi:alpha-methylacyl-CoA racemase
MAGPLHGLRVVELAGIGPGPFAAMLLADLGADVVRVDRVGTASPIGADPVGDLLNRGKRSIAVDLKQPAGVQTVLGLAGLAHALIEGWRPGVAERLGVGPDAVLARNPALVYGRMTGWGQHGPLATTAGHDVDYIALAGALDPIGPAGGPPQIPVNLIGDFGGGSLYLVVGILAALREADRTGRGQVVDAAIVDGTAHLTTMLHGMRAMGLWQDRRGANLLDGGAPFYAVYETADARHMAVGALEPQFYAELLRRLDLGDADLSGQYDTERWPQLRRRLAERFATRTRAEWTTHFAGSDACVTPVLTPGEAVGDPHLRARGTFVERHGTIQPAPAPRFSVTPAQLTGPPPLPGQHGREILDDWGVQDATTPLEVS